MSHFAKLKDGTAWPKPNPELGWRLRYVHAENAPNTEDRTDQYLAAEIVEAYHALIALPEHRRRVVIRELRRGRINLMEVTNDDT